MMKQLQSRVGYTNNRVLLKSSSARIDRSKRDRSKNSSKKELRALRQEKRESLAARYHNLRLSGDMEALKQASIQGCGKKALELVTHLSQVHFVMVSPRQRFLTMARIMATPDTTNRSSIYYAASSGNVRLVRTYLAFCVLARSVVKANKKSMKENNCSETTLTMRAWFDRLGYVQLFSRKEFDGCVADALNEKVKKIFRTNKYSLHTLIQVVNATEFGDYLVLGDVDTQIDKKPPLEIEATNALDADPTGQSTDDDIRDSVSDLTEENTCSYESAGSSDVVEEQSQGNQSPVSGPEIDPEEYTRLVEQAADLALPNLSTTEEEDASSKGVSLVADSWTEASELGDNDDDHDDDDDDDDDWDVADYVEICWENDDNDDESQDDDDDEWIFMESDDDAEIDGKVIALDGDRIPDLQSIQSSSTEADSVAASLPVAFSYRDALLRIKPEFPLLGEVSRTRLLLKSRLAVKAAPAVSSNYNYGYEDEDYLSFWEGDFEYEGAKNCRGGKVDLYFKGNQKAPRRWKARKQKKGRTKTL